MEPILIGYLARHTPPKPEKLQALGIKEICCVHPDAIWIPDALRLEFWQHQQRHNAVNHYNTEEIAWTVLRDAIQILLERDNSLDPPWRVEIRRPPVEMFDLYAFKVLPIRFVDTEPERHDLPPLKVAPLPADYERLGYDAVGWKSFAFICSPLICNHEVLHQEVNQYCLFDELDPAVELARRYSGKDWEPVWPDSGHCDSGLYCVVEVWRKTRPFAEPRRCGPKFEWSKDLLYSLLQHKLAHGNVFER